MSDTRSSDSLVQRLAVNRLAASGVLDHRALRRMPEKFSHAAGAHVLPRLHRRIEPSTGNTESLPLVRIDRSVDPSIASVTNSLPGASTSVATASGDGNVTRPSPDGSPTGAATVTSFVSDLVARQTPGITRTNELVARRVADSPGLIGTGRASNRLLERANHSGTTAPGTLPSITTTPVAPGVVQRVVATAPASSIGEAGMPPMTMRDASSMPSPLRTATTGESAPATLPGVAVSSVSPTSIPLLSRKMDAAARLPVSSAAPITPALPVTTVSKTPSAAPVHLLFRKPDAAATASHPPTPAPTITRHAPSIASSPTGVVARMPVAPDATLLGPASMHEHDPHLDWIAEQVGHRLARRLEVERERMGVRQWRQLS